MKKIFLFVLSFIFISTTFIFTGCASNLTIDTSSCKYSYVVIDTGNCRILHKLSTFSRSQEISCCLNLSCCHNRVIISYVDFVIYQNKPDVSSYDCECSC